MEDVVEHFFKTTPAKRKPALEINEEPVIKRRKKSEEKEEELRSDVEENTLVADYLERVTTNPAEVSRAEEEVKLVPEKRAAGPVGGRSSDSSGKIIQARGLQYLLTSFSL